MYFFKYGLTYSFILLLFFSGSCFALKFDKFLDSKTMQTERTDVNLLENNQFYISMPFASDEILNGEKGELLKGLVVIKVELVYTRYCFTPTFDQRELNRKRMARLQLLSPELFEHPLWEFRLVEQTGSATIEESNKMMHGFIITYRPVATAQSFEEEANYLRALFSDSTSAVNYMDKANTVPPFTIKTRWDDVNGFVHDTIWGEEPIDRSISPPASFYNVALFSDSIVSKVFGRNPSWKDAMIVTDATGSMSPYIKQVFSWLKTQSKNEKVLHFVFFNDGDGKTSSQKKPGETGGIYIMENGKFDRVLNTALKCMKNGGGGGEKLENDVEAILKGLEYNRAVKEVILVADNLENMRDHGLMTLIDKPVRVILCGAENRVNVGYLDLARATGGSVHSNNSDVFGLDEVKENEIIEIDGKSYLFYNGKFQYVY